MAFLRYFAQIYFYSPFFPYLSKKITCLVTPQSSFTPNVSHNLSTEKFSTMS